MDPKSIKIFASMTPIIGRTEEEAQLKYQRTLEFAEEEAGLAFSSAGFCIDLSKFDLDQVVTADDLETDSHVLSHFSALRYQGADIPTWKPRNIGKSVVLGANGPTSVGSVEQVADILEEWIDVADLDGFNYGYVISPGSFEDLVELSDV